MERQILAFQSIKLFVGDLWEGFGEETSISPLRLYKRLTDLIKLEDKNSIERVLAGFKRFLKKYHEEVWNDIETIPEEVCISYTKKVYLEIGKFIREDPENIKCIQRHLNGIDTILNPNQEKVNMLTAQARTFPMTDSSSEGEFLSGLMERARTTMENTSTDNPMLAISSLFQSGVIGDMVSGLQRGVESGQMDVRKLMGTVQNMVNTMMPEVSEAVENIAPQKEENECTEEVCSVPRSRKKGNN